MNYVSKFLTFINTTTGKWVLIGISSLFIFTIVAINVSDAWEWGKSRKLARKKQEIEKSFQGIENIIDTKKYKEQCLDNIEDTVIQSLKEYKKLLEINHYENDSVLNYINNVHIDSILSKLPELHRATDSL